ncbi:hypothetical protein [Rhodoferax sp.]|uniref:hypothetical protein n=1 Tax=Rhodoferax sp. TaxID=50421 RepID=UPI00374D69A1
MVWHVSLKSSLLSLFGSDAARADATRGDQLEKIRTAMLECLAAVESSNAAQYLEHRVRHAADIQSLWYLRSDLMVLLSSVIGETAARTRLDGITPMFRGLLPKSLASRANRLGG